MGDNINSNNNINNICVSDLSAEARVVLEANKPSNALAGGLRAFYIYKNHMIYIHSSVDTLHLFLNQIKERKDTKSG